MDPDTSQRPEKIEWRGVTYRLMGKGRGHERQYYLSQAAVTRERKGAKGLHVAVWQFHHERTVPRGQIIHHKDHDPFNNTIGNLECVTASEHHKEHPHRDPQAQKEHLAAIREMTKAWHRSPEGREWHRQNAANYVRKPLAAWCVECGEPFTAKQRRARYCSALCGNRYRHRRIVA
jgi:hypothetical protein